MKYQISITGYIDSWTKRMVRDKLNDNKGKHVDVAIDSLGGEVSAGLAICQMFKSLTSRLASLPPLPPSVRWVPARFA